MTTRKKLFVLLILSLVLFLNSNLTLAEDEISISFINPGHSDETFWVMVSEFMEATADDLGIELEILYAERNRYNMVSLAKDIATRAEEIDYVIAVNEDLVGDRIIEITDAAGIDTFIILNELRTEQKEKIGEPREIHQHWLGSLFPNNIAAGYKIAVETIKKAKNTKGNNLEMAAINGSRATPAAVHRETGLNKAIKEYEVTLNQTLYGSWDKDTAFIMTQGLLRRYPELDIIWAANDPMAFGAIKAIESKGLVPGEDIFVGGLNWDNQALKYIKDDKLATSIGGHFMTGGWALIVLFDYHHGIDYAQQINDVEFICDQIFTAITKDNLDSYYDNLGNEDWTKIDFRQFSKTFNPTIEKYNFSLQEILKQFN